MLFGVGSRGTLGAVTVRRNEKDVKGHVSVVTGGGLLGRVLREGNL